MRTILLAFALAACQSAAPPPAPVSAATAPGTAAATPAPCDHDAYACARDRLAACDRDHHAWKIATRMVDTPLTLEVADTGAALVDTMGVRVRTADATHAIDCIDSCPTAAGPASVCFGFDYPINFEFDVPAGCSLTGVDGSAWHGHPTWTLHCKDLDVTYARDLRPVRDALIAAGVFKPDSVLARVDGLVIAADLAHAMSWVTDDITEVSCDALALPPGARVLIGADDVETARAAVPAQMAALQQELQPLMQQLIDQKMRPLIRDALGEVCLGKRDHYDEAEVDACAKQHPDRTPTEDQYRELGKQVVPAIQALVTRSELPRRMRTTVEEPVCGAVVAHAPAR